MSNLTLNDIKLFLEDLLSTRAKHLQLLSNGATTQKLFQQRLDKIKALPEALAGRPLVELLSGADLFHDNFGKALFYLTAAYQILPSLDLNRQTTAKKIQETFIPVLDRLRDRYPDEAARAKTLRPKLTEMEPELKGFAIDNGTLFDVASEFVSYGEKLGVLLSQRADVANASDRSNAARLLASTLGLIGRVRASLVDEREVNPDLPKDIEALLFGYLDLLAENRAETAPAPAKPTAKETNTQEQQ